MAAKHPPGPQDYCFGMRSAARLKADILGVYEEYHRTYGDAMSYAAGPYRLYFFFHPDQVREVLVTRSKSMIRFPRVMKTFAQWNGDSVLIAEGERWIRQRRLVQPAFQPRRLDSYGEMMVDATKERLRHWQASAGEDGEIDLDVDQEMTQLTLSIICKTMFDMDVGRPTTDPASDSAVNVSEISEAVSILSDVAFHEMQAPIRWPLWLPTEFNRRKRWAIQVLDNVVWQFVKERRKEGADHGDLLSMLLTTVDEEARGGGLTDKQIRDEMMALLLAGHDTTAAAMDWLWYCLASQPEVADRCHAEIDSVLGDRDAKASDIEQLPYLTATIKETLRLYPPAVGVFLRQAANDVQIGDYLVKRKSLIGLSSYVTHRDARWFPDPETFDPTRFLPPQVDEIHPGAYFPFGMGPRVCIGQAFAMTEMALVAATLLQSCSVTTPPNFTEPVGVVTMALRPKDPLKLRWRLREKVT